MTQKSSTATNPRETPDAFGDDITEPEQDKEPTDISSVSGAGRVIRLSTLVVATVGVLLAAVAATLGFLLVKARGELAARDSSAADQQRAESIATDYAVGAATINYQDLPAWNTKLKANTAPAMASKFDATAPKLQQILLPLKWVSNGRVRKWV